MLLPGSTRGLVMWPFLLPRLQFVEINYCKEEVKKCNFVSELKFLLAKVDYPAL